MINLKDNLPIDKEHYDNPIITKLADKTLKHLSEQENFIIFPPTIKESTDLEDDQFIFERRNGNINASNVIGILKEKDDEIRITSRFYDGDNDDYFIRYMLGKVTSVNVTTNQFMSDKDNAYHDLLVFMFPYHLDNAMKKGVFKAYVKKQYNDANIKGPIDFSRHIVKNVPFTGRVAYNTREYSYDNEVTQLIRHTIHKLQEKYEIDSIGDSDYKENVNDIIFETPNYSKSQRLEIITKNIVNPIRHGYYYEYFSLQQLCLKILNDEQIGFGKEENEINGVLIDVAWLWEKYIDTLLPKEYIHADNKTRENGFSIYSDRRKTVYPDFYSTDTILDAKYKLLENDTISGSDLYQISTYLHVRKSSRAGVVYPAVNKGEFKHIGILDGYGGTIFTIGISIPQDCENYDEFVKKMKQSEDKFRDSLSF